MKTAHYLAILAMLTVVASIVAAVWSLVRKRSWTVTQVFGLLALLVVAPAALLATRLPLELYYAKREILAAEKTVEQNPDAKWLPDSTHDEGWADGLAAPPAAAWRVPGSSAWRGVTSGDLFVMLPGYRDLLGIGGWCLSKQPGATAGMTMPPRWWLGPPPTETRKVDLGGGWSLEYLDD